MPNSERKPETSRLNGGSGQLGHYRPGRRPAWHRAARRGENLGERSRLGGRSGHHDRLEVEAPEVSAMTLAVTPDAASAGRFTVEGELDLATSGSLVEVVGGAIDRGQRRLVLD